MASSEEMSMEIKRQTRIIGPLLDEAMQDLMKKIGTPTPATSVAVFRELISCAAQVIARCQLPDIGTKQFLGVSGDIAFAMNIAAQAATDMARDKILAKN